MFVPAVKKLLLLALSALLMAEPLAADAANLNGAFGNLLSSTGGAVSVNQPGYYQSGARGSFSAGGLDMRLPSATAAPTLFSFSPPSISAGCSGVSAFFGGFSFISGQQFEQLLKSIASGAALGMVSMLALKVLCPQCQAVVQALQTMSQDAAKLAINSCELGRKMASRFLDGNSSQSPAAATCNSTSASSGIASDFMEGMTTACQTTQKATALLQSTMNSVTGPGQATLNGQTGMGNVTWPRLSAFDGPSTTTSGASTISNYDRKLLLLNVLGADLYTGPPGVRVSCQIAPGNGSTAWLTPVDSTSGAASRTPTPSTSASSASAPASSGSAPASNPATSSSPASSSSTKPGHVYCPPRLDPGKLFGLFMCGWPGTYKGPIDQTLTNYCATYQTGWTPAPLTAPASSASNTAASTALGSLASTLVYSCSDPDTCDVMPLTDLRNIVSGEGFIFQVNDVLMQGVRAVENNTPMPAQTLQLMQAAPFPLYQAINAAAVYPAAGQDLIETMSFMVAQQIAEAMFDKMLQQSGGDGTVPQGVLSRKTTEQILAAIRAMQHANQARQDLIANNFVLQKGLTEQIRQINQAIQQSTLSPSLLNNVQYGQTLYDAVTPQGKAP